MERNDRNHADIVLHLQMIQRVIERMGDNAFKSKQWALLTMVAILTVFGTLDPTTPLKDPAAATRLFLSPLSIWFGFFLIDSYFIYLERRYRAKFDAVRKVEETDFNMGFTHDWRQAVLALYSLPNLVFYLLLIFVYFFAFSMFANFGAGK